MSNLFNRVHGGTSVKNHMFAVATGIVVFAVTLSLSVASAADSILIDFSSAHCPPCRAMEPVVAQLERAGIPVRRVDVDREQDLAIRYGIRQTPTFVVVSGGRELTRLVGIQSAAQLQAALATDPSGPLFPTNSKTQLDGSISAPQTRLAPINASEQFRSASIGAASTAGTHRASFQSEAMPSQIAADAAERARAATVRIKVHDGHGYGVGTGTIIDTHGEEALVLTCGHLFRDTDGKGRVEVEIFVAGQIKSVAGQVIDYDADDKDIALIAMRPGMTVYPVAVIGTGQTPVNGQTVFSYGCDRGDDPSRRDTRITGVNKYNQHKQMSNLEIAGAPIDGRSGGGLFDHTGRLIGVCNSADYKTDIGIYTGPGSIHWQLDRVNMSALYQNPAGSAQPDVQLAALNAPANMPANSPNMINNGPSAVIPAVAFEPTRQQQTAAPTGVSAGQHEVIVIIRDKMQPSSQPRVMTLDQPTPDLMRMLNSQSRF